MNEHGIHELYAPEMMRQRREDLARTYRGTGRGRRTTRRALAKGLHRLADRLDG